MKCIVWSTRYINPLKYFFHTKPIGLDLYFRNWFSLKIGFEAFNDSVLSQHKFWTWQQILSAWKHHKSSCLFACLTFLNWAYPNILFKRKIYNKLQYIILKKKNFSTTIIIFVILFTLSASHIYFPGFETTLSKRFQENGMRIVTFGNLCDVSICNSNVRDPFQVRESSSLHSCALQRVRPKFWNIEDQCINKVFCHPFIFL